MKYCYQIQIIYCAHIIFDECRFSLNIRYRQYIKIQKEKADLDNKWVVPYNRDILVKYQCHMNIEICCHTRSIKYFFRYCLKVHDTETDQMKGRKMRRAKKSTEEPIDEINTYFDVRYVCGSESAYRIFGYPIHYRTLSVEHLPFHLLGQRNCTFHANESLKNVVDK